LLRVRHPNVISLLATAEFEGKAALILDRQAGGSLRRALDKNGGLNAKICNQIALDISSALTFLHNLNIAVINVLKISFHVPLISIWT